MPLPAGSRLGPYEIVGPLGAGGMGEVYKARDTRLERTVAIKVLPPSLAGDPEFRARFEREAKSISALNHPHICTLYDVGEAAEASFLVMEHLEGQTLADRLTKGPLPVDEALDLASQIAAALDKAHRQGIVHRDLKPANVFLVRGGGVSGTPVCKLLDFGLAKMGVAPSGSVETRLVSTPTPPGTTPLTAQGSILGTFQYMAPEQIEGQEADARTDIWAFGCVLYEMLTGRRAFEGRSQASLIGSSRWIIFSSFLASGQGDLYRRAADGTGTLERLTDTSEGEAPQMVVADGRRVLVRRMRGATGYLGALTLMPLVPGLKPEAVLATSVPPQVSGEISPDGRWIAYQSAEGSTRDEIHVRPFPRTESGHWQISSGGGTRPMWSKSGRELFYVPARPDPLMSVQVHPTRPGESFSYSTPIRLFGVEKYRLGIVGRGFDISPDGQRFLMAVPVGTDDAKRESLTVVTHWFDELTARVKAK